MGVCVGCVDCHPARALNVVLQLIRIRVPVQLAHPARFNLNQSGGDQLGRRESRGVDDANSTSVRADGLLSHEPMAERRGRRARADDPISGKRTRHRRLKDIKLLLREVSESAFGHAEIFGENLFPYVGEKVGDEEGLVLIEVAIVEDKQKL
jgi:hypothetical protein